MNFMSAPQCKSEPPAQSEVESLIADLKKPLREMRYDTPDKAAAMLRSLSSEHALAVSTFKYQSRKIARLQEEIARITAAFEERGYAFQKAMVEQLKETCAMILRAEKAEAALASLDGSKAEA